MEKDKGKGTKETECPGHAGHYSPGSSSSPITPAVAAAAAPPLHRCASFPPPAAPLSRRRWTAKSQALLGCTSHPPRGHPRATSASPLCCLLDPRPKFGLLVLPPVTVLKQVVPRLVSPTVILRVPTCLRQRNDVSLVELCISNHVFATTSSHS